MCEYTKHQATEYAARPEGGRGESARVCACTSCGPYERLHAHGSRGPMRVRMHMRICLIWSYESLHAYADMPHVVLSACMHVTRVVM